MCTELSEHVSSVVYSVLSTQVRAALCGVLLPVVHPATSVVAVHWFSLALLAACFARVLGAFVYIFSLSSCDIAGLLVIFRMSSLEDVFRRRRPTHSTPLGVGVAGGGPGPFRHSARCGRFGC